MDITSLEHDVQGDPQSVTLVVFLQGWPDSKELWKENMDLPNALSDYRQLYINFPNHGKEKIPWGQDFKMIALRTKHTIDSVPNIEKRILVSHDWGCIYGYVIDQMFPKYFQSMVALDVPAYTQIEGVKAKFFVMAYQSVLIGAFLIGGGIGNGITKMTSKLFKHEPSYFEQIGSDRNYPYYYYWKNQLLSRMGGHEERILKGYKPSIPVCYFFGKRKPMQFHGQRWIKYLKGAPGSSIEGLDAGHWLMGKYGVRLVSEIHRVARL